MPTRFGDRAHQTRVEGALRSEASQDGTSISPALEREATVGTQRFGSVVSKRALGAALLIFLTAPLHAASFVKVIGARTRNSVANSSLDFTVTFSGVAAGNSILVTVQTGGSAGDITCSDPRNGVYAIDVVSDADGAARIAIASRHGVVALLSGDVIRCS